MALNKRGEFTDTLFFLIIIFIASFVFIAFAFVFPRIADGLNQSGINVNNDTQLAIDNLHDMGTFGINGGFAILFAGLILIQLMGAFFVRQHPVFLFIYFVMLIVTAMLAIYLGNAFDEFSTTTLFTEVASHQPIIAWVWDHILAIVIVIDVLTAVILFSKVGQAPI